MDEKKFEEWCSNQDSRLWKNKLAEFSDSFGSIIFAFIMGWYYISTKVIHLDNLRWIYRISVIAVGSVLLLLIIIKILKWIKPNISKAWCVSCVINKIANQLSFYVDGSNKEEVIKTLKKYKRIFNFERKFPSKSLFKESINIQNKFYDELEDLPKKIYYAINNSNIIRSTPEELKRLAYYIRTDDNRKLEELSFLSEKYYQIEEIKSYINLNKLKHFIEKKWVLLIIWIIILGVFSFSVYGWFGLEKNTIFLGFIGLITAVIYIIYSKKE